ncbi:MAG: D-alanyl-D-alanine carboxypeptidase [Bacilli bacterium]|nr:D-alanyl-D-alanine carboxypeptidase [Bacilli bacterium]
MKNIFLILVIIISFFNSTIDFDNSGTNDSPTDDELVNANFDITSEAGILIEYQTGKVLFNKNEDKKLYPASMTKMIGLYLVLDSLEQELIKLDDEVIVSSRAASMGGTQIFLQPNESISIEELVKSVAINSANDAICALAETISGSIESFVELMNKTAKEFGCTNTNFVNPTGFDDPNHYTTAKDMSIIARNLLSFEDKILQYTSKYDDYIRTDSDSPFWLVNTNKLVKFYEGCDGLKTGFTQKAGFCLTATAKRNNVRLISVVMNSKTKDIRSNDTVKLFNYGFSRTEALKVYSKDQIIVEHTFNNAEQEKTPLYVKEDIYVCGEKGIKKEDLEITYSISKDSAPISKDEVIGILIIKCNDVEYEYDLYAYEDVDKLKFGSIYLKSLLEMMFN